MNNAMIAAQIIGGVITVLNTYLSRDQVVMILDKVRENMVSQGRPPSNEELEALMTSIENG